MCHCLAVGCARSAQQFRHRQAVLSFYAWRHHSLSVGGTHRLASAIDFAPTAKQWHTPSQPNAAARPFDRACPEEPDCGRSRGQDRNKTQNSTGRERGRSAVFRTTGPVPRQAMSVSYGTSGSLSSIFRPKFRAFYMGFRPRSGRRCRQGEPPWQRKLPSSPEETRPGWPRHDGSLNRPRSLSRRNHPTRSRRRSQ